MTTDPRGLEPALQAMIDHVAKADPIFRPSQFWAYFRDQNLRQLGAVGIGNFKRTINQNYYNWLPTSAEDNQFRALLRLTADHPSSSAFLARLDGGDAEVESVFAASPLASEDAREIYRLFVGMLWSYTCATSPNDLPAVLAEPELGNPLPVRLGVRLISQDLANSIRERNTILAPVEDELAKGRGQNIVEIGAGYGRLAYVVVSSAPCRYTIVDIPPALHIAQWYLSRLFPAKRIFRFRPWKSFYDVAAEIAESDVVFTTPDQFARFPDNAFDIGIAISNLAEMSPEQIRLYLDLLGTRVSSFVYIKQWITSDNTLDGHRYHRADFDLAPPWARLVDRTDAVQDRFFETLWHRPRAME
ncbi:MAG: putative sugar O-methyltransferase [Methylocystis sp.]|nr:putative sugar O-methyltransferase [Rhodobacter sp.]MCA3583531.1 putative sugar O-methyltransferase [Methylocystis sp.]